MTSEYAYRKTPLAAAVAACLATGSPVTLAQGADEADQLEEIVVTATRREQSVLDIPYNISAQCPVVIVFCIIISCCT